MESILEKGTWRTSDFESMGWHDATLLAIRHAHDSHELLFDIDYIVKWVKANDERSYSFWVAPATLIFENVSELHVDLYGGKSWAIDDVRFEKADSLNSEGGIRALQSVWTIECQTGDIAFRSSGFVQYFRTAPVFIHTQSLGLEERGGISFDRRTFDS